MEWLLLPTHALQEEKCERLRIELPRAVKTDVKVALSCVLHSLNRVRVRSGNKRGDLHVTLQDPLSIPVS